MTASRLYLLYRSVKRLVRSEVEREGFVVSDHELVQDELIVGENEGFAIGGWEYGKDGHHDQGCNEKTASVGHHARDGESHKGCRHSCKSVTVGIFGY